MKLQFYSFIIFLGLLFVSNSAKASHIMGGNVTYTCDSLNPNVIHITLALYRDCDGITLGTTEYISITSTCFSQFSVPLTLIPGSGNDITPVCPQFPNTPCPGTPNTNVMVPIGVEEYIYQGTITFPSTATCTDFEIGYSSCCRNAAIGTLQNPASEGVYFLSKFKRDTLCNNSPQFLTPPVPYTCVNQPFTFNHGVSDIEGDSLNFSLIDCYTGQGAKVVYLSQYNGLQPLSTTGPVVINKFTGTISFTPNTIQIGVICVLVEEYRNGVKIGETLRDIQVIVTQCTNPPPTLSGFNGTSDLDTVICPGQTVSLTINSTDPNPFQTVTNTFSGALPGAVWTCSPGQNPICTLTWTPPAGVTGAFLFSVSAQDDGCPLVASTTKGYIIEVRDPVVNAGPDQAICGNDSIKIIPQHRVNYTTWNWTPTNGVSNPNIKSPSFKPTQTTTYIVTATNGFCTATDTITIFVESIPVIDPIAGTKEVCPGGSTQLTASGTGVSYAWTPSAGVSDDSIANPTFTPAMTTVYTVTASSQGGCTATATVTVTVRDLPNIDAGPDKGYCIGESTTLSGSGDPGWTYSWEPANFIVGPSNIPNPQVQPTSNTYFVLTVTDAFGCVNKDSTFVTIYPGATADAGPDITIVAGTEATLTANPPGGSSYTWNPGGLSGESVIVRPAVTTTYTVSVIDANGCPGSDEVTVTVYEATVKVPNAFTPNSDGVNDHFYIIEIGELDIEYFRIYNRWGQLIFESAGKGTAQSKGWDGNYKGEPQNAGTYTWVVRTKPTVGDPQDFKGNVTLIR